MRDTGEKTGLIQRLSGLLFPEDIYCICCGAPIAPGSRYSLCPVCLANIHWAGERRCAACGRALSSLRAGTLCGNCRIRPHVFTRGFSCVEYGLIEKEMLHRFKYQDKGYYAVWMGRLMAERMESEWEGKAGRFLAVPLPMHKERLRLRGYDQAALLAAETALWLGIPCRRDLLIRQEATLPMRSLGKGERGENVRKAFWANPSVWKEIRRENPNIDSVLLIDDIMTTGSSGDGAAAALLSAGVKEVWLLAFAAVPDWSDAGTARVCG